jgi:hypothetical protein
MKNPAVLFYTSDFITGTLTMTDAQKGQYITLLCLQHQQGYLTEEDMLNICKTYDVRVFSKFQKDELGYYYNERMKHESEKRSKYQQSRSDNRNANKTETIEKAEKAETYVEHMENININDDLLDLYNAVKIYFDEDCRPKTEKQKQEWLDTLEKLIRIDGYSPEHIQNIVKRTRMDDFWKTNFLSVLKLRKKNKEGISYFTVFEKKLINGTKKTVGADTSDLANLVADKIGIRR